MLYLFHGDNNLASRNAYYATARRLKGQFPHAELLRLNGNKLTETELIQALEAPSLLGISRIIRIEGLLSRRKSKEKDKLIKRLAEQHLQSTDYSLLLWEAKPATPSTLKKLKALKDCRIQEFKLSKFLFKFLDSLRPQNGKQLSLLLHKTLETDPPELVMFMLVRRITELLLAVGGGSTALDGVRFDWQKAKLRRQAQAWKFAILLKIHRRLLEIDEAIKTGSTPADLTTHLDILLASI